MKVITLTNNDKLEIIEEAGNIFAFKKSKNGSNIINKLNVSRNMNNCCNSCAIALSNSAFFVFWLNTSEAEATICGRRYTPQGLAGKIYKFSVEHSVMNAPFKIELKDDFFIVLTWYSNDGNIYKKTFNQDGDAKSDELFVSKIESDDISKQFKEGDENIRYTVIKDDDISKNVNTENEKLPSQVTNNTKLSEKIFRPSPGLKNNTLMPLKVRPIVLPSIIGRPIVLNEKPTAPLSTRRDHFLNKKKGGGMIRMHFN